ncbi:MULTISPECIES: hypothetical protein [unclassified Nocardia]|uniref:hypothetical protein n=1 Tax=unclassified Nocardia TaxID=2637762 RepID=UPI001CE49A03|nr:MULTISPECIES: hypothetical protein [unclassified Nocardia]
MASTGASDSNRAGTFRPAAQSLIRCDDSVIARPLLFFCLPLVCSTSALAIMATRLIEGSPAAENSSVNFCAKSFLGDASLNPSNAESPHIEPICPRLAEP